MVIFYRISTSRALNYQQYGLLLTLFIKMFSNYYFHHILYLFQNISIIFIILTIIYFSPNYLKRIYFPIILKICPFLVNNYFSCFSRNIFIFNHFQLILNIFIILYFCYFFLIFIKMVLNSIILYSVCTRLH